MPLTVIPEAANLRKVYGYLDKDRDPVKQTRLAFGCVTPPEGFAVPSCRINVVPSGTGKPPAAAAGKLGIQTPVPKYRATLSVLQAANPGTNRACYLTTGVYETNWTFLAQDYKAGVIQALKGETPEAKLPSYLVPWENPSQKRVYLIMPAAIAPLNAGAEREHCSDFIHAYNISLQAVHAAFQRMAAAPPLDGFWSEGDARRAMERKVEEQLPPALRPIAFDRAKLTEKFQSLQQKSRDGRDGMGYHSFGLEILTEAPPNLGPVQYLTGGPRPEAGRVYMIFTKGTTQIGGFPSSSVIQL